MAQGKKLSKFGYSFYSDLNAIISNIVRIVHTLLRVTLTENQHCMGMFLLCLNWPKKINVYEICGKIAKCKTYPIGSKGLIENNQC